MKIENMLKFLWISLYIVNTGLGCTDYAQCIYKELFHNYTLEVRPMRRPNETLLVYMKLNILTLKEISERTETMDTIGYFRAIWTDHRLQWNPDFYGGVDNIIVPASSVWLPDVVVYNSVTSFYDWTYRRDFMVSLKHTGRISWSYGGILSTDCSMNLGKYPFDSQHCVIIVDSWKYQKHKVELAFEGQGISVNESAFTNPVWQFKGSQVSKYLAYGNRYWRLTFSVSWKRKPLYYSTNILIPIALLSFVSLGVYWVPPESGEKISLAITALLAFSVFQIVIMDSTPVNSDVIPEITKLVLVTMMLSTLSMLASMLAVYINSLSATMIPPSWLHKLCFQCLSKVTCTSFPTHITNCNIKDIIISNKNISDKRDIIISSKDISDKRDINISNKNISDKRDINISSKDISDKNKTSAGIKEPSIHEMFKIGNSLSEITSHIDEHSKSEKVKEEWMFIARIIDRTLFWIHLISLIIFVGYLFSTNI